MIRTSTTHSYTTGNMAALYAPLPKLTVRPVAAALGWTEAEKAAFALARDTRNLAAAETNYKEACGLLGDANRAPLMRRRAQQAAVMRRINSARATLRAARKALAASLAASAAFTA